MEATKRRILASMSVAILVVACGGGGSDTSTGASADPGTATEDPGTVSTEAPPAPSVPDVSLPPQVSGDPATADVCGLVTIAEMEQLFGVSGVTQGFFAGPPDTCDYQLDSAPFAAINLNTVGSDFIFDAVAADTNTRLVAGIGDRALYNSQQLVFLVQKGDNLIAISAFDPERTDEERAARLEEMAKLAAGRM